MRTEQQNDQIEAIAHGILRKRGIEPTAATYEEASEAISVAAEAVARGKTTLPDALAVGALSGGVGTPDEATIGVLAKFSKDGKFVCDLSITEEEFLAAAIAAEEAREASDTIVAEQPMGVIAAEQGRRDSLAAQGWVPCSQCGKSILDCKC